MKLMLGILFYVVGFLVERVGDLGGFAQFGGATFTWWMATGCYFFAFSLLLRAGREYVKRRWYPEK